MNFVFPSFLWALFILVIPILIHLFNFRRTKKLYYSNTKLLHEIKQETTQKRNLKKYLILASRLLGLLFLVLAFAQPFLPAGESAGSKNTVVIYLDNSYSMSATNGQLRAVDEGAEMVRKMVEVFPKETRFKFITNDFAPSSNSYKSGLEVTDLVSQIRLSPYSRSWKSISSRIGESNATVFWISDFQKSTLGQVTIADSTWAMRWVPIKLPHVSNVFIDTAFLEHPWMNGERNVLHVKLRNSGDRKVDGLVCKLRVNAMQAASTTLTLEANSAAATQFDLVGEAKARATISIADFPVSFDNDFFIALNPAPPSRIVNMLGNDFSPYIKNVFANKELFHYTEFSIARPDYQALAKAELAILNGVDKMDEALTAALKNFILNSGRLLLLPSVNTNAAVFTNLLPQPVSKVPGAEAMALEMPDMKNPFFENVFETRDVNLQMPTAKKQWQWNDQEAILKFKDGSPFLSKFDNVYVMAAAPAAENTNFGTHALFVPVMYRIAAYNKRDFQRLYTRLSSPWIALQADSLPTHQQVKWMGDKEIVPAQTFRGGQWVMQLPQQELNPGFYEAVAKDTLELLAFNQDKAESEMETYSVKEIEAWRGKNTVIFETDAGKISAEIQHRFVGRPLWKIMIVLALCALLAEVLLIRFLK